MWQWKVTIGVAAVVVFVLYRIVTGAMRSLRLGNERLNKALAGLTDADIPRLAGECKDFFWSSLGVQLDSDHWQEAAAALDAALKDNPQRQKIVRGFSRPELSYYWVLPLGAYLGELLRQHTNGEWRFSGTGAPIMEIAVGGGTMTTFPFDKVQKHYWQGDPGDLTAYVHTQTHLEEMLAQLDQQDANP